MKSRALTWAVAALLLTTAGASVPAPAQQSDQYAQLVVREQIVIRMHARQSPRPASPPVEWKERKGPKCVPAKAILGAALLSQKSVDLVMKDRRRIRAKLESSCPALDYYYGFYITPNADGMICADRDIIRSRVGGHCQIDGFRTLEAAARN
jgi:hypothetical protein